MSHKKPILCLDFDGVLHSYTSGWQGAHNAPDPPVEGARDFLAKAVQYFEVHVFSSRSHQEGGIDEMARWCAVHFGTTLGEALHFPEHKPPAFLSLDDRGLRFDGRWPDPQKLLRVAPWNKGGRHAACLDGFSTAPEGIPTSFADLHLRYGGAWPQISHLEIESTFGEPAKATVSAFVGEIDVVADVHLVNFLSLLRALPGIKVSGAGRSSYTGQVVIKGHEPMVFFGETEVPVASVRLVSAPGALVQAHVQLAALDPYHDMRQWPAGLVEAMLRHMGWVVEAGEP